MAGDDPTIKIKVETDTSQATKGLDQAAKSTESFGSRFKSTFAWVLAANVIQNAAAKIYDFGKSSVEAYEAAEATSIKYEAALSKIPGASDKVTASLTAQAKALSLVTVYSTGQSKQALSTLASYGLTGDQLGKLLPLVQDYAAKTGQDLPSAAQAVGKALLGQGRALKGVGIDFVNQKSVLGNYGEIVDGLQSKVGGLAKEMGGTSAGKMQIMQNRVTALKVQLGAALVPAILQATKVLGPFLDFITKNTQWLVPLAIGITAVSVAFKVLNGALALLGMNPAALLILAIAAGVVLLTVAIYELVTHWSTVWNFILGIVQTVWNWIRTNWPLLLPILLGPIGIAAALIITYWSQIWNFIMGVWSWIAGAWGAVYGWIIAPIVSAYGVVAAFIGRIPGFFASALAWIAGIWSAVYTFVTAPIGSAVAWISGKVSQIGGWFAGVAGSIAGAMSGVFNAIISPFQQAWNWIQAHVLDPLKHGWNTIANAVNSIHFSVSIPSWVPVVGGKGFDWAPPHVPTLARGGIVTQTGLILAHAGEAISPIPSGALGRSGPAVRIEHAHFSEKIDVETFGRRLAWTMKAKGV